MPSRLTTPPVSASMRAPSSRETSNGARSGGRSNSRGGGTGRGGAATGGGVKTGGGGGGSATAVAAGFAPELGQLALQLGEAILEDVQARVVLAHCGSV